MMLVTCAAAAALLPPIASAAPPQIGRRGMRGPPDAAWAAASRTHGSTPGSMGPRAPLSAEATSDALWPMPASDSKANATWTKIGGDNEGAQGPDCPYTQHGPGNSLAVCQAACNSAGAGICTDINWNPSIGDCVYRRCVDPLHPVISPADGYAVYAITRPLVTYCGLDAASFRVTATGFTDAILDAAMARAVNNSFGYGAGVTSPLPARVPGLAVHVLSGDDALRLGVDESYTLVVEPGAGGAVLTAQTVFGALQGLETFAQLVVYNLTDNTYEVATARIADAPRFAFRGVMIDTSRHFMSVSVIKRVVDMMAAVKLNTLSLHLTDDQSWPLEVPSWPGLAAAGAYSNFSHVYSPAAVADLVQYALLRGVRVLPEFDSPSHFGVLGASYPQFAAVDSSGGLCMVDPSREEVFAFLGDIWRDIAAAFPADMLRIGGDEFQGCWDDCPAVKAWINATFGPSGTQYDAYHYYERRLIDTVRAHNRSTMAWLDIAGWPAANETWAKDYADVVLNVWTGCYSGSWQEDVHTFTAQNGTVVVSGPFYITAPSQQPDAPHFTWQQMYQTDLANFTGNSSAAIARVLGGELCVWDDAAGTDSGDLAMQITPFLFGVSEAFWSPQALTSGADPDEQRAHFHRCRLIQRGWASHPIFGFSTWCPHEYEVIDIAPV